MFSVGPAAPVTRIVARVVSIIMVLALGGCAELPKNTLVPIAAGAPGGSTVDMLVATMRNKADDPGEMFSGERGLAAGLRRHHRFDPAGQRAQGRRGRMAEEAARQPGNRFRHPQGRSRSTGRRRDLAAATRSEDARTAASWSSSTASTTASRTPSTASRRSCTIPAPTACRCWSPGRRAAACSPMATTARAPTTRATRWRRLFQYLASDPEVSEVSILAHSMGNWLALEALAPDGDPQRRPAAEVQERHAGGARRRCRRVPPADRRHGHAAAAVHAVRLARRPRAGRFAPGLGQRRAARSPSIRNRSRTRPSWPRTRSPSSI